MQTSAPPLMGVPVSASKSKTTQKVSNTVAVPSQPMDETLPPPPPPSATNMNKTVLSQAESWQVPVPDMDSQEFDSVSRLRKKSIRRFVLAGCFGVFGLLVVVGLVVVLIQPADKKPAEKDPKGKIPEYLKREPSPKDILIALKEDDVDRMAFACGKLDKMDNDLVQTFPHLAENLSHSNKDMRALVRTALAAVIQSREKQGLPPMGQESVDSLEKILKSTTGEQPFQLFALSQLAKLGPKAAMARGTIGVQLTKEKNEDILLKSVATLSVINSTNSRVDAGLSHLLHHKRADLRLSALQTLMQLNKDGISLNTYLSLCRDEDNRMSRLAFAGTQKYLTGIQDPARKRDAFIEVLQEGKKGDYLNPLVLSSLKELGEMGTKADKAVPAIHSLIEGQKDETVLIAIAGTLGKIGKEKSSALVSLKLLLEQDKTAVKLRALASIAELDKATLSVEQYLKLCRDDEPKVSELANKVLCGYLSEISAREQQVLSFVDVLQKAEQEKALRNVALFSLVELGKLEEDAVLAIKTVSMFLAPNTEEDYLKAAVDCLGKIGRPEKQALTGLKHHLDHKNPLIAAGVLATLIKLDETALSLEEYLNLAKRSGINDGKTRETAIKLICKRLPNVTSEKVPFLRECLKVPDRILRGGTLQTLHRLGKAADKAAPDLPPMLNTFDRELQIRVLKTLQAIGTSKEASAVAKYYNSRLNDVVRSEMLMTLAKLDPSNDTLVREGIPKLLTDLEVSDRLATNAATQQALRKGIAATTLLEIGGPAIAPIINNGLASRWKLRGTLPPTDGKCAARLVAYQLLEELAKRAATEDTIRSAFKSNLDRLNSLFDSQDKRIREFVTKAEKKLGLVKAKKTLYVDTFDTANRVHHAVKKLALR